MTKTKGVLRNIKNNKGSVAPLFGLMAIPMFFVIWDPWRKEEVQAETSGT